MQIAHWIQQATQQLLLSSKSAKLDAELLLCFVLQKNRAWLYGFDDQQLGQDSLIKANELLQRRVLGEPIAYITGQREFWSLTLNTHPSTLIPRPDTETLIEWALQLPLPLNAEVLDLGTGTGAIALALASERPDWQVQGVDFQQEAVALAIQNAQLNQLSHVKFYQSDWFGSVTGQFDLIVSNPPYIDKLDPHLEQGDVRFEPKSALVAEDSGLADLRHIIQQARSFLKEGGWLLLEHGYQQADSVQALLQQYGFSNLKTRLDLSQQPRITGGRFQPTT